MRIGRRAARVLGAALLILGMGACDDGNNVIVQPVEGTVQGTVTIDGAGAAGVRVILSTGQTATTGADGTYSIPRVTEGVHTATISMFPADVAFPQTSKAFALTTDGQVVAVDFAGTRIRTASISGAVTVGGDGVADVTVTLDGPDSRTTTTDSEGSYGFTGLAAGTYTVTISDTPSNAEFETMSEEVTVGVGENADVDFEGQPAPATVSGTVTVDGVGFAGATVTVRDASTSSVVGETTTDANGQYAIDGLPPGSYEVEVSGLAEGVTCDKTADDVTLTAGGGATVDFTCTSPAEGETLTARLDFGDIPPPSGLVSPGTYTVDLLDDDTDEVVGSMDVSTEGAAGHHFKGSGPDRVGLVGPGGWVFDFGGLMLDGGGDVMVESVELCFTGPSGFSMADPLVIEERDQESSDTQQTEVADPSANGGCQTIDHPDFELFFMALLVPDGATIDLGLLTMVLRRIAN